MGILSLMGQPNTPGPLKFAIAGSGFVAGAIGAAGLDRLLVGPERGRELRDSGVSVIDSQQAEVYAMALPFTTAAGIALGVQRRTPSSGLTTASQVAAAALLSTVVGAAINADTAKADDYVVGTGVMAASLGAGVLIGVRDEVSLGLARMSGLALFGAAIGVAAPTVIGALWDKTGELQRGFEHRDE